MRYIGCLLIIVSVVWSCIKPYNPNVHSPVTGYLVVEGNLNTAPAPTTITLSRTVALTDTASELFESGAIVTVEGSDGSSYSATGGPNGTYNLGALPLDSTKTYRLDIKTTDGNEFQSKYVAVIPDPPIDSVNATYDGNGAHLFVNTHNPLNNSHNYLWSYTETWEYHSAEYSYLIYNPDSGVLFRTQAQQIFTCWRSDVSTGIFVYSTSKLSQDVVSQFNIINIAQNDQRLSVEYSLLLNQYTLSDSAFYYLQLMQANTENLGSIFDPLPSSLRGNITCVTNPSQPVVGYVNASGFQQIRIFLQEPSGWDYDYQCPAKDTTLPLDTMLAQNFGNGYGGIYVPINTTEPPGGGWVSNYSGCVNCTAQGGSTTKPSFWP